MCSICMYVCMYRCRLRLMWSSPTVGQEEEKAARIAEQERRKLEEEQMRAVRQARYMMMYDRSIGAQPAGREAKAIHESPYFYFNHTTKALFLSFFVCLCVCWLVGAEL